jgi:hypothetical protein
MLPSDGYWKILSCMPQLWMNDDMKNDIVYHGSYVGFHHPVLPDCGIC